MNTIDDTRFAILRNVLRRTCLLALLLTGAAASSAQTASEEIAARELQRQQERERAQRQQLEATPDVRLQPSVAPDGERIPESESPCFTIREIRFDDPTGRFGWALAAADGAGDPGTGRCLG
ncbi:MAG: ShlB/FhaC/HecB family hemolysin secretion/activation protein, partial [Propionivibrio sp.]|nr:ShlB/FhaC/HecB family hemolysin secretion/activation protein [Propionivibrio sp.]